MASETKFCTACGVEYTPRRPGSRFCSRACTRSKNGGQNRRVESWWVNNRGYVEGRIWVGGLQRRVKKHRWVMEQHLGRPLGAHEDVHHRNGVKTDNRIENLELMSHSRHSTNTGLGRQYRRGYRLALSPEDRARRATEAKRKRLWEHGHAALARARGEG